MGGGGGGHGRSEVKLRKRLERMNEGRSRE